MARTLINLIRTSPPPHDADADLYVAQIVESLNEHAEALDDLEAASGGSGGIEDGNKGDVTVANDGDTWTVNDGAITSAKLDTNIAVTGTFGVANQRSSLYDVTLGGNIRLNGTVTKALAAGSQDDVDPGAGMLHACVLALNGNASNSIATGLVPYGSSNSVFFVINKGAGTVTLSHDSTSSAAANRFKLPGAVDRVLAANEGCWMIHDGLSWYLV